MVLITGVITKLMQAGILGDDDDDNKWFGDTFWKEYITYIFMRTAMENSFYWNPADAFDIIRSPIAGADTVSDMMSLLYNILQPWNYADVYETGRYAGENKLLR